MNPSPLPEGNGALARLPRRERENLRQRGEILDTALKLFSEKGYHNVSMQQIAKQAEFGVGTIYKFFSNKQDLYKILIMETAEKWQRVCFSSAGTGTGSFSSHKRIHCRPTGTFL